MREKGRRELGEANGVSRVRKGECWRRGRREGRRKTGHKLEGKEWKENEREHQRKKGRQGRGSFRAGEERIEKIKEVKEKKVIGRVR